MHRALFAVVVASTAALSVSGQREGAANIAKPVRFATFNVSFYRRSAGELVTALATATDPRAKKIAEIIQRTRPDVLLLNEFDHDAKGAALERFRRDYLAVGQRGARPIDYPHAYVAPSNTGVPSGLDLDRNGRTTDPGDCFGYGRYPGQYAFALLSRFPIDRDSIRTFQRMRWTAMPGALVPPDYYSKDALAIFRLSSKNHCDVPIRTPHGVVHALISHPTPPVFDGPEDRNGRRNHDEIRLWADYVSGGDAAAYLVDDAGGRGGLAPDAAFVILGDLNADPIDGDGVDGAIAQLLEHPRIRATTPKSAGGPIDAKRKRRDRGDPALDTCSTRRLGLRLDYALPSRDLVVEGSGVFWPAPNEPHADLVDATDHRLVWVDVVTRDGRRSTRE